MKTLTIEINPREASIMADALTTEALGLRTNGMTGVVMPEDKFLNSDISEARRNRYLTLRRRAAELNEFVRNS
jgi:hypothetical protein